MSGLAALGGQGGPQPPSDPLRLPPPARHSDPIAVSTSVFSQCYFVYYVLSFHKVFVPMALELGRRRKECAVIPSKVWACLPGRAIRAGEKSFLPISGQSQAAVLSKHTSTAKRLGNMFLFEFFSICVTIQLKPYQWVEINIIRSINLWVLSKANKFKCRPVPYPSVLCLPLSQWNVSEDFLSGRP